MSEKPAHRFVSRDLMGDLQEALQLPMHIQGFLPTASGGYKTFGLVAGLWEKARVVAVAPFVADVAPGAAVNGVNLPEFPQARFYLSFTGGLGAETASLTVWHRSHAFSSTGTVGVWTKGQSYATVTHLEEILDPSLWHEEIYFQVTAVAPGATTEMVIWVQGVQDMTTGANVNVVVPPIAVAIDAFDNPPLIPDSVLAVVSDDGTITGTRKVLKGTIAGAYVQQSDASKLKLTEANSAAILRQISDTDDLLRALRSALDLARRPLAETRTSQALAQTSTTPGGLVTNEFRELVLAGYNWLARYLSVAEANPLSVQVLEQQLAAALSLAAGDTYYPSANGALMTGYKDLSVEFILLAGAAAGDSITLTLQISQDTTVPPAVGTWVDVTLAGFDLATGAPSAASYSAAAGATVTDTVDWDNLDVRQWRIKVTVVKATNNSTITLLTTRQKAL